MSDRQQVLGRIREALTNPSRRPAHEHPPITPPGGQPGDWLPAVGPTIEDWQALFARNAADLKGEFEVVRQVEGARQAIVRLAKEGQWKRVAWQVDPLIEKLLTGTGLETLPLKPGYTFEELEQCEAGISLCDALIAQTGTVLVTSRSTGGRAISVLPPHHIVLARRNQLVPDLPAAFGHVKRAYGGQYPSMISFITGPSRTGDIERILVLGAHGPRRLTILLLD
jgi:L-lactate dehydrogenase complex protein LldG